MADGMGKTTRWRRLCFVALLPLWVLLSGCNTFSAIDKSVSPQGDAEHLAEGRIALDKGAYAEALAQYEIVYRASPALPEAIRGYGEAQLGINGFVTLTALDLLQNEAGPNNDAPTAFRVAHLTRDLYALGKAVAVLFANPSVTAEDRLVRSLARLGYITRTLRNKYDTNLNGRLDTNDDIDYETRDNSTPPWTDLYRSFVTGSTPTEPPLARVADELITGFAGRGTATWTFILPEPASGTRSVLITPVNRDTVLAVLDLDARLRDANLAYGINAASFATILARMDGLDTW